MVQPADQQPVVAPGPWTAPDYVVDQLAMVLRPPDGPPGDAEGVVRATRAMAWEYANRIWLAAAHAGAVWAMARNNPPMRVQISPERLAELREKAS